VTPNAPLIVSMSSCGTEYQQCTNNLTEYGTDNCTAIHIPNWKVYLNRTNIEFQKLGALGHSLLAASGDGGISGCHFGDCVEQAPMFPSTSPFVLAVGATIIFAEDDAEPYNIEENSDLPPICTDSSYGCTCLKSKNETVAEFSTAGFDTGGGFSMFFDMPSYQSEAVQAYLKSGVTLPNSQYWSPQYRGYPDVAAIGMNVCIVDYESSCELSGGTSASTPIFAGIVALLNQDRLNSGKAPLGFLNPLMYQMFAEDSQKYFNNQLGQGYNNNGGCPEDMGFNSMNGMWDPLTGIGSPKFAAIRAYIDNLP